MTYHWIIPIAAGLATLYIIRRDLTGFNTEKRAGKWRVDGRKSLKEAWQDYVTKRELRRHLRASYRVSRSATVRQLFGTTRGARGVVRREGRVGR